MRNIQWHQPSDIGHWTSDDQGRRLHRISTDWSSFAGPPSRVLRTAHNDKRPLKISFDQNRLLLKASNNSDPRPSEAYPHQPMIHAYVALKGIAFKKPTTQVWVIAFIFLPFNFYIKKCGHSFGNFKFDLICFYRRDHVTLGVCYQVVRQVTGVMWQINVRTSLGKSNFQDPSTFMIQWWKVTFPTGSSGLWCSPG